MMTSDDATHWDARYERRSPSPARRPDALDDATAPLIPTSGRALDLACGTGAESVWLAARGLHVTAVDVSPKAVELTKQAVSMAGLDGRVDVAVHDLDDGVPESMSGFDVIVCQRFRDTSLYDVIVERLDPDGIAIVTVLSQTGATTPGSFHAPSGELAAAFDRDDCEVVRHEEADGAESIVVRRVA
ncbi:class I SAM-dependent methyltransferase [Ilumatobacter coccineus]|uniref:Putative methyltransferase n=1 Tax=Ilumatobacter coccineus (strain NBRC 103263 / KCTC 29153 / YM16-304) TaxID=1313172 RepID=A0A6C7EFF6_ILUCY|nr:methyltransferase domain-containing protein [Ilumatobacter coccineus]BAN03755.1 putative methyltransferase [Ilumatobacter coccineus YM16-304]